MTDKQSLIRALQQFNGGAGVITKAQFARFMGVSHQRAKKRLAGLPAFDGKYYLLSDVAELCLMSLTIEE